MEEHNNDINETLNLWKFFNNKSLDSVFSNLYIASQIYLTLPSNSCSVERAFSKLARMENNYRTTSSYDRLNSLMILSSENDISQSINCDQIIRQFAFLKVRKKNFNFFLLSIFIF